MQAYSAVDAAAGAWVGSRLQEAALKDLLRVEPGVCRVCVFWWYWCNFGNDPPASGCLHKGFCLVVPGTSRPSLFPFFK